AEKDIEVANVSGCNAPAVAQYVLSSILSLKNGNVSDLTLGIVGVGHVGQILARWAKDLGMNVLLNDPPRAKAEGDSGFVDLDTIAREAEIISFHTPMSRTGDYPTYHLGDHNFFESLKKCPIIINSARGPITDTDAIIEALDNHKISAAVIDCWENEPAIDRRLLERAVIATPHIAGYSDAGKRRATLGVINAVAKHFEITPRLPESLRTIPAVPDIITAKMITESYNPAHDTATLKAEPEKFEQLRDNYNLRPEPVASQPSEMKKFDRITIFDFDNYIGNFVVHHLKGCVNDPENFVEIVDIENQPVKQGGLLVWCSDLPTAKNAEDFLKVVDRVKPTSVVMLSNATIYDIETGENINELAPINPDSQDALAEQIVTNSVSQIPLTVLRLPRLTVGTGMTGILRDMANAISRGTYSTIKDIDTHVSVIHASDVGRAVAVSAGSQGIYNINDRINPTVAQLADGISYRIGKRVMTTTNKNAHRLARLLSFLGFKYADEMYRFKTTTLTYSAEQFCSKFDFQPVDTVNYLKTHVYDETSL
ncbi:MAG: hypothetical protein K2H32_09150, partial [Muribaculaceae bacterium]|nr:hypothetical protein [Muribaculaceae bacterium]